MSREALHESLSAMMDNQADELELRRVLAASGEDAQVRATWSRYQVARSAMHGELLEPRLDLASAVSAALADEPVPVVESVRQGPWRSIGRLAVAASVTVAVLIGVRFYNQDEVTGSQMAQQTNQPMLSIPQVQGPALLAGFTAESEAATAESGAVAQPGWHEQRLPVYLRQHAQQAAMSGADSALPHARAASLEGR
jgi:sigma-E factor negative regulatory protein RseA